MARDKQKRKLKEINGDAPKAKRRPGKKSNAQKQAVLGLDLATDKKTEEELELEASLFGKLSAQDLPDVDLRSGSSDGEEDEEASLAMDDSQLFMVDIPISNIPNTDGLPIEAQEMTEIDKVPQEKPKIKKGPIWNDPADAQLSISLASNTRARKLRTNAKEDVISGQEYEAKLRQQHAKLHPAPNWAVEARKNAKRKRDDAEDDNAVFLSTTNAGLVDKRFAKTKQLAPGKLNIERLRDITHEQGAKSSIQNIAFHPLANNVLLTTSSDHRLRLFSIDGQTNPLLHTLHVPELPITNAQFHPKGESVLLTGNRPFFLCHDLISGQTTRSPPNLRAMATAGSTDPSSGVAPIFRFSSDGSRLAISGKRGYVHLVDYRSPQNISHVGDLKSNSPIVKDLCWTGNANDDLCTIGSSGEISVWDVRMLKCKARWIDQGGFGSVAMSAAVDGRYFSTSTSTGIVNVYDGEIATDSSTGAPIERQPSKAILNLTTSVDTMLFNGESSILAVASSTKRDALKLVHLPSLTVFSNWPTANTPLGHVRSVAFSAQSSFLAIASDKGPKALLYHIPHYT